MQKLTKLVAEKGPKASLAMEQVALEDGHGIPAIAVLVLVVVVIIAVWVEIV